MSNVEPLNSRCVDLDLDRSKLERAVELRPQDPIDFSVTPFTITLLESRHAPIGPGDVRPTPTSPFDGSTQLRSPSGRAPVRVGGPITPPRPIKSPSQRAVISAGNSAPATCPTCTGPLAYGIPEVTRARVGL